MGRRAASRNPAPADEELGPLSWRYFATERHFVQVPCRRGRSVL